MDGNSRDASSPSPSDQPPSDPSSSPLQPDHVYLRVIYLVTGDPRPPHNLGQVDLNTTVSALKDRIQHDLLEHPAPSEQRLIYQGRPLLRNEATLREVLRLEPGAAAGPLPYTIHIVINSRQDAVPPTDPPNALRIPSPEAPQPTERLNPFRAVETSAARLQESLARIQQQIEVNRADLMNVQQRIGLQHHNIHHNVHLNAHHNAHHNLHHNAHIGQPIPIVPAIQVEVNGQALLTAPTNLRVNAGQALEQQPTDRGLPPIPWIHAHNVRAHGQAVPAMFRNPAVPPLASQPALTPQPPQPAARASPRPDIQASQGPNGTPTATERRPTNMGMPLQQNASASGNQQHPPQPLLQPQLFAGGQPISGTIMAPHLAAHLPTPFSRTAPGQNAPSSTLAWIISSPRGPEGLLFAPGHGFYTTTQLQQPRQSTTRSATEAPLPGSQPTPAVPPPVGEENAPQNINARRAQPRRDARPDVPALAQARRNEADNDLFAFLIRRGWLFLRLYLFMFVFSEPGTWKRWALIVIAAVVCLQPRNGPHARALTAARHHLDNLIAPRLQPVPAAQARQQAQADPLGNAGNGVAAQRPANIRGAVQITPEEAAARLIRQNQGEGPASWRAAAYRIEQSIALFLASLIPGVGERHVRAREEARREAERLEQERVRAEEETVARAQTEIGEAEQASETVNEAATSPTQEPKSNLPHEQSSSSSVQVRESPAETEGLRNRNN
ncbi:hypothetical protein A1O3_03204 [Capronia epimyces CBS 606.96]|uniref:Ubiquitin-like domain-containing protein n=1 Tax=Capronia epimyces CBS 606.96 TaxID=1182542 RepID=W9YKB7_9EURO|nr:uncharacterized protein A1O3_03204 [Capronia epimyces CBS 606.96]EXJ90135.1 hypothetical protein A1O3_03204 [Capronia epimyces CBS 606.96]